MKHVLVTGGAGFIGSHTVDLLLQEGFRVTVLDNLATGKLAHLPLTDPHLEFIQADIVDFPALSALVKNCDGVLHLAALSSVPQSIEDPVRSLKVNTLGFLQVLEAIREAERPVRLVYASSAAVYGGQGELPARDDVPLGKEFLSPYALEKVTNEHYAALYTRLFGLKSLGLRYFNVYGLRQDPASPYSGVISKFIENYQRDLPLTLWGDGTQSRDFIYVEDVARANWLALQSHHAGILNIATGKMETLTQLIRYIEMAGKKPASINYVPSRVGDIYQSYGSIKQAQQQLGFSHRIDLQQGIKRLTDSLENSE
jgi:UDP-glucose 4-epimerase